MTNNFDHRALDELLEKAWAQLNVRHHTPGGELCTSLTTDDVAALLAEIERLRTWAEAEQTERYKAEDQRTDERSTVARLEAEIARLHSIEHACAGQIDSLLAENEQLRAALDRAPQMTCWCGAGGTVAEITDHIRRMKELPHNALSDYHHAE